MLPTSGIIIWQKYGACLVKGGSFNRKAFHILGESMYEILHVSPGPLAKSQAARALGRMGYIMGQEGDFNRY